MNWTSPRTWLIGQGKYFLYSVKYYRHFWKLLCLNGSRVTLYKIVQIILIDRKNMAASGWGQLFPSTLVYIGKVYKNLLVKNDWANLKILWYKWSFVNPLPRLLKFIWSVKKHGHQGRCGAPVFPMEKKQQKILSNKQIVQCVTLY